MQKDFFLNSNWYLQLMNQIATKPILRPETEPPSPRKQRRSSTKGRQRLRDPAMKHWLAAFHQLHTEDETYAPVALRFEFESRRPPCSIRSAAQLATDRHVYEVALRRDARGEVWVLIAWEVDVRGIVFCDCTDREEALLLFTNPAQATGRWHGVRRRPELR